MEFKQLEIYVKAFELKSFSKTAEEIFLSQPSVSTHINALEKELQVQLIHRSNKEFLPTKAGKVFYELGKEMISLREKAIKKIRCMSDFTSGSIDILASSVPAQYILPSVLSEYHKLYPNVSFNIKQTDSKDVAVGIATNTAEIGFVGSKIESSKCVYQTIASERLVVIAPNEKRFEGLSQEDIPHLLRSEYFVEREAGSGTRHEYEECLLSIGVKPSELKISASFNNTQSIIHAVSNGLGLSIVSELAANHHSKKKLIVLPVDKFSKRYFYMITKKDFNPTPTAESFQNFLKEQNK